MRFTVPELRMKAVHTKGSLHLFGLAVVAVSLAGSVRAQSKPDIAVSLQAVSAQRTFLNQYCVSCHNQTAKTAGLMLDQMDVSHIGANAEVWEKVVRKLRAGMMPPAGAKRPEKAAINTFA